MLFIGAKHICRDYNYQKADCGDSYYNRARQAGTVLTESLCKTTVGPDLSG